MRNSVRAPPSVKVVATPATIIPAKPERRKSNGPAIAPPTRKVPAAGWRKQVSFEDQLLRDDKVSVSTPNASGSERVPSSKVKKPKSRGKRDLSRGRSIENIESSSESEIDNRAGPTKPPRRKNKNRTAGTASDSEPVKLKGILKKQSSTERQSDDSVRSRRSQMRRGSSVDSALPPSSKFTHKGGNGLRLRRGQDNEETHSRTGPLTLTSNDPEEKRRGLFEGFGRNSDRPGAPYPLREQDGKIWLTWQETSPGACYRLQVRSNDQQLWTDVSDKIDQNVHIVTGLMPGVSYRFRVAVRNKVGESVPSKASQRIGIGI